MVKVTIVGAGMAGLTAALRLAERGCKVTILERDNFIGGKFRATKWKGRHEPDRHAFHEHSYHMFLNWYHNFWQIAKEINVVDSFTPMTKVKFLHQGQFPHMKELENFGALTSVMQNLRSGVLSPPDMFLYMYSVIDLLSTRMRGDRYRELISVNAFASSKLYSTEASVSLYDEYLAKTFALASYESSVKAFQVFLEYGTYCPDPMYWSLEGDCYNYFLKHLLRRLEDLGVEFIFNHSVKEIAFDADGDASEIKFDKITHQEYSPSLSEMSVDDFCDLRSGHVSRDNPPYKIEGPLILAVPHEVLSDLLKPRFLSRHPELGDSDKLRSVPMASVHLHLNEKFDRRLDYLGIKLPPEPVVLVDSKYKLSFVANSSLWPDSKHTYLNIVASDSRPLNRFDPPAIFLEDWQWDCDPGTSTPPKLSDISLDTPATSLDHILKEFRRFVHFEQDEIDLDLLHIDRNVGRELFINDIGSWKWRPHTRTKIRNVFLAGDFCKNFIDVVSLEGAVVSGLEAAECVRWRYHLGEPIRIVRPKRHPPQAFWPLKIAMAPYAVGAKLWCVVEDWVKSHRD